jgi:hypothetical protein
MLLPRGKTVTMREENIMKGKRQSKKKRRIEQQVEIEERDFISIITLRVSNVRHQSVSIETSNALVPAPHKFACCDPMGRAIYIRILFFPQNRHDRNHCNLIFRIEETTEGVGRIRLEFVV